MFTLKHELETVFLLIITAGIGVFFALNIDREKTDRINANASLNTGLENSIPAVLPTSAPEIIITTESQTSSDGTMKVMIEKTINNDKTHSFKLSTSDGSGENEKVIFNNTVPADKDLVIPYNTWSPDNKYFFIQQNSSEGTGIWVFKAGGDAFAEGETFLDLTGIFKEKISEFTFKEATGWGSENLIVINTTKQDGSIGPSFWFEVPSKAVIRLSTLFL